MTDFRFRTDWRGRLVLQIRDSYQTYSDMEGGLVTRHEWRDASSEDLAIYYAALHAP